MKGRGHFGHLVDMATNKFNEIYAGHKSETENHIKAVKDSGNCKDLTARLAWDFARAARYWEWEFLPKDKHGFIMASDATLNTFFKQALRNSEIWKSI